MTVNITELLDHFFDQNKNVILVSLCTSDGFSIYQASIEKFKSAPDKVAAISSTFSSVSDSIANEIITSPFQMAIIETADGNFISIFTTYLEKSAVLTITTSDKMPLGELRIRAKNLSAFVAKLKK